MVPITSLLANARKHRQRTGRPLVTLSYAQSLDGSIAAFRGRPIALSGRESLVVTHKLRAAHDAVLVGIGTVLADNPHLNVRFVGGEDPQPVVLDSWLRFPLSSHLLRKQSVPPLIVTTPRAASDRQDALEAAGAQILRVPSNANGQIDLNALLRALAALGVNSVMVEGGARTITSFFSGHLVDRLVLTITPAILGGLRAVDSPVWTDVESASDGVHLPKMQDFGYEQLGADIVFWAVLSWEGE